MGSKRVGLARTQGLIENLKRELNLNGSTIKNVKEEQITLVHNVVSNHTLTAAQNGAVCFWTHGSAHDITLPDAKAGMYFKFVLVVGSAHANRIVTQSADKFYGKAVVSRTGATVNKIGGQTVLKASGVDNISLHSTTTTLGGNTGDMIELYCYEDGFWNVDARLSLTGGDPGTIAVMI